MVISEALQRPGSLSYRQIARQMEIGEGTVRRAGASIDLNGGALTSPEDLTGTRGMVLRYI
jgi:hypothetical protein